MAGNRRYKLLCPIARALDRIGDRWTLLILRDLHAGPARFSDLQSGLSGIATNLLTDRLGQLIDDGLVVRYDGEHGVTLYALTELGERTRDLIFELALFGARFPPDKDLRKPGNLKTVAVTLGAACQRVATPDLDLEAELIVDGEKITVEARNGTVRTTYAPAKAADVWLTTSYEPMIAAAEGEIPMDEFLRDHTEIKIGTPGKDIELMKLLSAAMTAFAVRE